MAIAFIILGGFNTTFVYMGIIENSLNFEG